MRLSVDVAGDTLRLMRQEIAAGEQAVSLAMRDAARGLQSDWRRQITSAGLGDRLAKSIRAQTFPAGRKSVNAAALVWSKAPQILRAHDAGAVIKPRSGRFLSIPTPAAGQGRFGARLTPEEWERRRGLKLRLVKRPGKPGLLVADGARISKAGVALESRSKTGRNQVTAVIFVLVPQVRLRKSLDLDRDSAKWLNRLPGMIVEQWVVDRLGIPLDG